MISILAGSLWPAVLSETERADGLVSAGGGRFNLFITQLNLCHSVCFTDTEISHQLLHSLKAQFTWLYRRLTRVLSNALCGQSVLYTQYITYIEYYQKLAVTLELTLLLTYEYTGVELLNKEVHFCAMTLNIVQLLPCGVVCQFLYTNDILLKHIFLHTKCVIPYVNLIIAHLCI